MFIAHHVWGLTGNKKLAKKSDNYMLQKPITNLRCRIVRASVKLPLRGRIYVGQ